MKTQPKTVERPQEALTKEEPKQPDPDANDVGGHAPSTLSESQHVVRLRTSKNWFSRLLAGRRAARHDDVVALRETVTIAEVVALVHYVIEAGVPGTAKLAARLDGILANYDAERSSKERQRLHVELVKNYAALTAITNADNKGINGKTLRNSQHIVGDLWIVGLCGFVSFAFVASTHILGHYVNGSEGVGPMMVQGMDIEAAYEHGLRFLLPTFWGALGATIALTMKIAEHARNCTFDSRKLRGQFSRIGLGAVLATAIVHLFFGPEGFEYPVVRVDNGSDAQANTASAFIRANAVAFLTGLGVKPIYEAFESVVGQVSAWIARFNTGRAGQEGTTRL